MDFRLNTENRPIKELVNFYDALLRQSIDKHAKVMEQVASSK